jgi:hypothetical protein
MTSINFKNIPNYKCKNLKKNQFEHASAINRSIRRMAKNPFSKMDLFLVSQINDELLNNMMHQAGRQIVSVNLSWITIYHK